MLSGVDEYQVAMDIQTCSTHIQCHISENDRYIQEAALVTIHALFSHQFTIALFNLRVVVIAALIFVPVIIIGRTKLSKNKIKLKCGDHDLWVTSSH